MDTIARSGFFIPVWYFNVHQNKDSPSLTKILQQLQSPGKIHLKDVDEKSLKITSSIKRIQRSKSLSFLTRNQNHAQSNREEQHQQSHIQYYQQQTKEYLKVPGAEEEKQRTKSENNIFSKIQRKLSRSNSDNNSSAKKINIDDILIDPGLRNSSTYGLKSDRLPLTKVSNLKDINENNDNIIEPINTHKHSILSKEVFTDNLNRISSQPFRSCIKKRNTGRPIFTLHESNIIDENKPFECNDLRSTSGLLSLNGHHHQSRTFTNGRLQSSKKLQYNIASVTIKFERNTWRIFKGKTYKNEYINTTIRGYRSKSKRFALKKVMFFQLINSPHGSSEQLVENGYALPVRRNRSATTVVSSTVKSYSNTEDSKRFRSRSFDTKDSHEKLRTFAVFCSKQNLYKKQSVNSLTSITSNEYGKAERQNYHGNDVNNQNISMVTPIDQATVTSKNEQQKNVIERHDHLDNTIMGQLVTMKEKTLSDYLKSNQTKSNCSCVNNKFDTKVDNNFKKTINQFSNCSHPSITILNNNFSNQANLVNEVIFEENILIKTATMNNNIQRTKPPLLRSYTMDDQLISPSRAGGDSDVTQEATNMAIQILSLSPSYQLYNSNNFERVGSWRYSIRRKTMMRKMPTFEHTPSERSCCSQKRNAYSESTSLRNSIMGSSESSPSSRRRRVSVKSNHLRKPSRIAPRVRRRTLSSSYSVNRSPSSPRTDYSGGTLENGKAENVNISSVVYPSRRLSVAVSRRPSNSFQKKPDRRCSEPFLLDPITIQNKWSSRKASTARLRRRLSSAGTNLPTSSKQKLQALAKDELLASLNVPLTETDIEVASPEEGNTEINVECSKDEENEEKTKQSEITRKEMKRLMIIEEILDTEKNYISCLETLNEVFRNQLENTSIITEKELNSLFPSHLQEIKTSHTCFMKELEERMNNDSWRGIIGDIFAKMTSASANLLEIYTAYVNSFPKSISTLSKCTRSSQKFRKFLEDCYENPIVERLDLPSFLLSPVQRLPRYILLLRELLKYTDEEHPDRYFISEAMKEMEALISSLNNAIHSSMAFYSASDSKRKKMQRQFTSKKRKQRASTSNSKSLLGKKIQSPQNENKSSNDPDQGYCSFGEPKEESPEDEGQLNCRKPRSATWRTGKRTTSIISNNGDEKGGVVMRRKNDALIGRNTDTRKSWRRSLGAVISHLWSKDDVQNSSINSTPNGNTRLKVKQSIANDELYSGPTMRIPEEHLLQTETVNTNLQRKGSLARRKIAIIHTPPPTSDDNLMDESVNHLNAMVKETSIDDQNDNNDGSCVLMSPISLDAPNILSSSTTSVDEYERERTHSTSSEKSSSSAKVPNSPSQQNFKRGKLRGSAGPVFKTIFQKNTSNRNSALLQKTLSWDELNVAQHEKRHKRFSISRKSLKTNLPSSISDTRISNSNKSLNNDSYSTSSEDTLSSQASAHCSFREHVLVNDNENNNSPTQNNKSKTPNKEKKNKLIKTLKNLVTKK